MSDSPINNRWKEGEHISAPVSQELLEGHVSQNCLQQNLWEKVCCMPVTLLLVWEPIGCVCVPHCTLQTEVIGAFSSKLAPLWKRIVPQFPKGVRSRACLKYPNPQMFKSLVVEWWNICIQPTDILLNVSAVGYVVGRNDEGNVCLCSPQMLVFLLN